jgi:hypothetical protein
LEPASLEAKATGEEMQLVEAVGHKVTPELAAPGNAFVVDVDRHGSFLGRL